MARFLGLMGQLGQEQSSRCPLPAARPAWRAWAGEVLGAAEGMPSREPLLRTLAQPGQGLPAAPGTRNGWNLTLKEGWRGHCCFVCFTGHFPSW